MAPVKISHVVSFTSQDPRYPVENLLCDDSVQPWLSCPQDRSRQLKVELQLERASPIGYIDIGNCGCAFLQVDVGRSSWPLAQPYVTLVTSTTLMTPADSKLGRNRCGVRMFKEGDFLAVGLSEKWDRLRITCSQPFNKQAQFGLSFVRVRTPQDPDLSQVAPAPPQVSPSCGGLSLLVLSPPGHGGARPVVCVAHPAQLTRGQRTLQVGETAAPQISLCRSTPRPGRRGGRARGRGGRPCRLGADGEAGRETGICPICAGECFGVRSRAAAVCPPRRCSPSWGYAEACPPQCCVDCLSSLQPTWREIVNKKLKFPTELLDVIQEGNLLRVQQLLQVSAGVLQQQAEGEDRAWRDALNLAIQMGNEEITGTLLRHIKFDFRQIHEALLVAVDTNQPPVVKMLLYRLDQEKSIKMDIKSFSLAFFDQSIDNSRFAPGVTPLTLACEKDLYEIVDLLMQKGHTIARPHKISCACLECSNGRKYDLLKFSLSRINTYKGIASRAYLSIASDDAMLTAFKLSQELQRLSRKEPEFKPEYLSLELLTQEFAFELLGMCRNQSEVMAVLNDLGDGGEEELDSQAFEEGIPNLARLRLAVNYNQKKQFVAHPICQQVLSSIWCGGLSGWRGSNTLWKLFVSCSIFLAMPLLSLLYWIAPKSQVGKMLKIPVIKFLLHSASYLWFLIFLLVESMVLENKHETFLARNQTVWENSLHMVWVAGFFWHECKELWIEGLRGYLLDWWNFLDIVILSLYLASFALRMLVAVRGHLHCRNAPSSPECYYFTTAGRHEWHPEDPQFVAEVLFAVTSMLSFTRLTYILPAHESLGTLQISIGKMIDDMIRFMFILMIILTAFLCGLNNIYVYYQESKRLGRFNETFPFLFWTMFGMEEHNVVDMSQYLVAEFVGRALYGIFTIVMVIVLLNMLVAMITNSFQKIEDDADVEWKFARSKLYLTYFREGLTLPVPFNVIPTLKSLFYSVSFFRPLEMFLKPYLAVCRPGHLRRPGQVLEKGNTAGTAGVFHRWKPLPAC
uniref:Transient receptor ion channel domain-containing protein n=1 Tax=Pelusios castaneus TaxID=367368 RepID=A0A8C8RMX5_9SAUR